MVFHACQHNSYPQNRSHEDKKCQRTNPRTGINQQLISANPTWNGVIQDKAQKSTHKHASGEKHQDHLVKLDDSQQKNKALDSGAGRHMFYQQHSRCQEAASCMLVWTRLANPKGEHKIWQWKGKLSHSQFQTCSFILHDYSQTRSGQEMTHKYIRSLLTVQTTAPSEKKPPSAPNTCCTSTT